MGYDSQAVWSLSRLPEYLWGGWRQGLRRRGVGWQLSLRILRLHALVRLSGPLGAVSWEEFLGRVSGSVERWGIAGEGRGPAVSVLPAG